MIPYNFRLHQDSIDLNIRSHVVKQPVAVLIHVHGFLSDFADDQPGFYNFYRRVRAFEPLKIVNYAMEFRNHGASTYFRTSETTFDHYVADLKVLVDFLKVRHGLPLHLFGCAMGATIGILYQQKYGGLSGLILVEPFLGFIHPFKNNREAIGLTKIWDLEDYYIFAKDVLLSLKKLHGEPLGTPICAFYGKRDVFSSYRLTEAFLSQCSNAKSVMFEACQHLLLKADVDLIVFIRQQIITWLAELIPR